MNEDATLLERIHQMPHVVSGRPTVRGTRVTVSHVLSLLAMGQSPQDVAEDFPELELEDMEACLVYARGRIESVLRRLDDDGLDAASAAAWREAVTEEMALLDPDLTVSLLLLAQWATRHVAVAEPVA